MQADNFYISGRAFAESEGSICSYSIDSDVESGQDFGDASEAAPLVGVKGAMAAEEPSSSRVVDPFARKVRIGINASWVVNILLLIAKTTVFVLSGSYAVLASAVDSLVDLLSQVVLAVAEYQAAT